MPPKKAKTPKAKPAGEKRCRHDTHNADKLSINIKSKLNCPNQEYVSISEKNGVNKFHPYCCTVTAVYALMAININASHVRNIVIVSCSLMLGKD